ncbi:putative N-alkane-inducible cytochrome P450 [Ophiobolus disseminans]|uniref:Putative N-alkane-inducible cytochrome P450 n=1 Tax=Ophiobolus disseminans TaxID=1469910 RepID=A0A6A7A0U3_9PLEO|nr:putative N-alkane-inducible cytochrome P450 [Ophiobolus disseminans]
MLTSSTATGTFFGITAISTLLALAILLCLKFLLPRDVLPGVLQLRGVPLLGIMPEYLSQGMPRVIESLTTVGGDGISYAKVFNVTLVSVHTPAMIKAVLAFPEENASRKGRPGSMNWSPFQTLLRLIGKSLFTYTGTEVNHQRLAYTQEFNSGKANAAAFKTIARIVTAHVDTLTNSAASTEIANFKLSTDAFALALWGEHLYGNASHHLDRQVLPVSERIVHLCGSPWPSIWYSFLALIRLVTPGKPTWDEANLRCQVGEIVDRNFKILEQHERNDPALEIKAMRRISMLSGGGRTGPFSQFAVEFAHLNVFGGHHSIGSLIVWLLIELDRHPDSLATLMTEIRDIDPTNISFLTTKTPYLDAVLNEVHRLYPTVHATVRVINRETRLATSKTPVTLKPGMLVYLSILHLHMSTDYWGADAAHFVPERFLKPEATKNPAFMPFSSGPRSCVGYKFANLAIKVYLVRLLQSCAVQVVDHGHKVKIDTLLETERPVAVRLSKACAQDCGH